MRWIVPAVGILFLFLMSCGCIQPSAAPVSPPTQGGITSSPADMTASPEPRREVNITATKMAAEVVVLIEGGRDAGALATMDVRITNYDGTVNTRTLSHPETGKPYTFTYRGNANAARINIIGTFSDGYQQTLLMTSL